MAIKLNSLPPNNRKADKKGVLEGIFWRPPAFSCCFPIGKTFTKLQHGISNLEEHIFMQFSRLLKSTILKSFLLMISNIHFFIEQNLFKHF